ncbi:MAG: Rap1a/Tai family immunity protein [Gammaproteobacteria bacterium]|nr:Rap1a/Tai family immunity protein [Gammaproteobacteria bacterium]
MNKFSFYLCVFFTCFLSNPFVFAELADGDSFLKYIQITDHENVNSVTGYYDGYINGVADSTVNVNWCPPYDFKGSQLLKTITRYYKENSMDSGEVSADAKDLILYALMDTYPCSK